MDFYNHAGKLALGSRLRRLGEQFNTWASRLYEVYHISLEPVWFPVFYVLSHKEALPVTQIADIIGTPHPVVSQIVKQMTKHGFVTTEKDASDGRVTVVRLSKKGLEEKPRMESLSADVRQAVESVHREMQNDLWKAMEEMEFLLARKDFYDRVKDERKIRLSQDVEIIDYTPAFKDDFKNLNLKWIEAFFGIEEADLFLLDHPDENIIKPGGHIFMARLNGEIVGTCAMVKKDAETYELAKMGVTPKTQGRNIGWLLGDAVIRKAAERGAKRIWIESNTILESAINLYHKLGFRKVTGPPSPYERCNIQMELQL